jgi:hypothetical protein
MPASATRAPARLPKSLQVLARDNGFGSVLKHCDALLGKRLHAAL